MVAKKPRQRGKYRLIRDFLREHKGKPFSDTQLVAALGEKGHEINSGDLGSFRIIATRDYPDEFTISGSRGNWSYCAGAAPNGDGVDALIVVRFGERQSSEFKIEHAREIWRQLNVLFGAQK